MKIKRLNILLLIYFIIGIIAIISITVTNYFVKNNYQILIPSSMDMKYFDLGITILMAILTYIISISMRQKNNNASKKQRIINRYLSLSKNFAKAIYKSENAPELSRMFNQKVQILNRQLNNEDYRDIEIDERFYLINREINNKFEEKYF